MKTLSKLGLMILAMMLALSLGLTALAEGTADPVPETSVTGTAVDEAQAKANALNEALTAYSNAKADSRKQAYLDSLKQELDTYVAAGKLTQDQADLIYEYYVEQMTLLGNNGKGFGRGGKGGQNRQNDQGTNQNGFGKGGLNRQNRQNDQGTNQNGFGKRGRHGRFGNTATPAGSTPANTAPSMGTVPAGI